MLCLMLNYLVVCCSEGEQVAGEPGTDDMLTEEPHAPVAETTLPDGDGVADKVVADFTKDIVSEVTPGEAAAEIGPVAPAAASEAHQEQVISHKLLALFRQKRTVKTCLDQSGLLSSACQKELALSKRNT